MTSVTVPPCSLLSIPYFSHFTVSLFRNFYYQDLIYLIFFFLIPVISVVCIQSTTQEKLGAFFPWKTSGCRVFGDSGVNDNVLPVLSSVTHPDLGR